MTGPTPKSAPIFDRIRQENLLRYEYHCTLLPKDQREVLELFPLLFQYPASLFFPSLTKDTLFGIEGYQPSHYVRELGCRYFHNFKKAFMQSALPANQPCRLEFLYLMGSAGTLAFAAGSDMDFWIGIDKRNADPKEIRQLQKKIDLIENWAGSAHEMEVHFFITDIHDLREENYGELGGESCGSALGKLLKDEFYRSMIHLAGKYPVYWAEPLLSDVSGLSTSIEDKGKMLDLGRIQAFNSKDIFGAVLWQILKGLHSPFKSVIKIGLLEYYALGSRPEFLCEREKRSILNMDSVSKLDPYLDMIDLVRNFKCGEGKLPLEAQLLEECFLIKCFAGIDPKVNRQKQTYLYELAGGWGLTQAEIAHYQDFRNWSYQEIAQFSDKIFTYFMNAYKRMRDQAMSSTGSISDRDLTIMGKTLRAYLQKESNKIPQTLSVLNAKLIYMMHLTKDRDEKNQEIWVIHADFVGTKAHCRNNRIYRHPDLLNVCAWLVVNGNYHPSQKLTLLSNPVYTLPFVKEFIHQFSQFLPREDIMDQILKTWDGTAKIKRMFILPNCTEPDDVGILLSLTCFTLNSFGEVHQYRFEGNDAMDQVIATLITPFFDLQNLEPDWIKVFKVGSGILPKNRVVARIQTTVDNIVAKNARLWHS